MIIKELTKKILAGFLAIALVGLLLFITNAFVGNPISSRVASKAIQEYVDQNYPSLGLELQKASYNFKDGSYMVVARSTTSIDTKFAIYCYKGEVKRDNYDSYVLGMFNTLQRLSEEYSSVAKGIVAQELGYENNSTMVMYDKDEYQDVNPALKLDMNFDRTLPLHAEVTIGLDLQNTSFEAIAEILAKAHDAFIENDCSFTKYSLYADNDGLLVMISEVTPQHIESGELVQLLNQAQISTSINGINVFIKDQDNK